MNVEEARAYLEQARFCVIATATRDGQPWVSPVFFNYDDSYRLIFESERDARHSRLIAENPQVTIVVSDFDPAKPPRALYLECLAREVAPDQLPWAIEVFLHGPHSHRESRKRTVDDYSEARPLRLYEAVPQRVYSLHQVTTPEGYVVDRRGEIPLMQRS